MDVKGKQDNLVAGDETDLPEKMDSEGTSTEVKPKAKSADDDKSPLERLLHSISSVGQWTSADEEKEDQPSTTPTKPDEEKPYHDPTKPDNQPGAGEVSVFYDDEGDEINVSPKKDKPADDDNTRANFTPVMLYRFFFRKSASQSISSIKSESEVDEVNDETVTEEESLPEQVIQEEEQIESIPKDEGSQATISVEEDTEHITAESFPIYLATKFKDILRPKRNKSPETNCPLCGQKLTRKTLENMESRKHGMKLWQVRGTDTRSNPASDMPHGRYRTELRIEADGSRSTSETFYKLGSM